MRGLVPHGPSDRKVDEPSRLGRPLSEAETRLIRLLAELAVEQFEAEIKELAK